MAKNREHEKPVQSDSDSGEEEEAASSEEDGSGESESEPEPTQVAKKPASSTPATEKKPQSQSSKPQHESSEESEPESESDSDGPGQKTRPLASKSVNAPEKSNDGARKPRSKPEPVTPAKSAAGKRPAEEKETEVKEAKKSRKKPEVENSEKKTGDDSKKSLFQRLWSEDDEIEVLKGMIEYSAKKKADPVTDLNAFHDFIKKNLHVDVSKTQLQDKIRRLKKKYMNNKSKEKEGKDRTFTNPHEQKCYDLSKKIWGSENGKEIGGDKVMGSPKANGGAVKKTANKKGNSVETESKDLKEEDVAVDGEKVTVTAPTRVDLGGSSVEERLMRRGAGLFEAGKGAEGEKEWNKLLKEEFELYHRQLEIKLAQSKLVLDAFNSTN